MPYVGIRCTYDDFDLRRELLLFDRIALPFLESTLRIWVSTGAAQQQARELEWLAERDVVFAPDLKSLPPGRAADAYRNYEDGQAQAQSAWTAFGAFAQAKGFHGNERLAEALAAYSLQLGGMEWLDSLDLASRIAYDDLARALAAHFTADGITVALPILSASRYYEREGTLTRADVLNIALANVPLPAADTELEKLLDFRSDPDVRTDFLAFHRWASETVSKNRAPSEVTEEVQHLVAQYQRHMKLHRLEQTTGAVETIVTVTAEAAEDIVKFKWSAAAKLLFSFRKRRISLLQAEATAPGHELAYLVKSQAAVE